MHALSMQPEKLAQTAGSDLSTRVMQRAGGSPGSVRYLEGEHSAVVGEVVGLVAWGLHHEAGTCARCHIGAGARRVLVGCSQQQASAMGYRWMAHGQICV